MRKLLPAFSLVLTLLVPDSRELKVTRCPDDQETTVKIGLLISDSKSKAARQGAEMAIRNANQNGGLNGKPFQLIVRSMEGPWGTGSKEAVDLIFEEKVWALLGSHDGRNAHLVEQASAKAHVVFLSAWPADPTLSQAFIPWFFNCVPNDVQQAESLVNEIYNINKLSHITIVYDSEYDSNKSLASFLGKIRTDGKTPPVQFQYEGNGHDLNDLARRIIKSDADCLILFCKPAASLELFLRIRQGDFNKPVYGPLNLLNEDELSFNELRNYDNDLLIPSGDWSGSKTLAFGKGYTGMYGNPPGMVASYAFDGMNLLIGAIKEAGIRDREKIQTALTGIRYEGVTGLVQFDQKGNRSGAYKVVPVNKGIPAKPKKDY